MRLAGGVVSENEFDVFGDIVGVVEAVEGYGGEKSGAGFVIIRPSYRKNLRTSESERTGRGR